MTASLHHAQPILTAAIDAGFRESGVQSLKNIDDDNSFPMVAVRSSGLSFESLVGYVDDVGPVEKIKSLVTSDYLEIMVQIANERFLTNAERMRRFEARLFDDQQIMKYKESSQSRRERKKAEGLRHQALVVKDTRKAAAEMVDEDNVASFPNLGYE